MTTRDKLLLATADALREDGIVGVSARSVAARADVNQALVFYHFGTMSDLVQEATRRSVDQSVAAYRERFAEVDSLAGLLAVGREMHARERDAGNVALMAQVMTGAQQDAGLAGAAAYAMSAWGAEVEAAVGRVLAGSALGDLVDADGLARAICAGFIGLELFEGVDPAGARAALDALDQLAVLMGAADDLGPMATRALRAAMRRRAR